MVEFVVLYDKFCVKSWNEICTNYIKIIKIMNEDMIKIDSIVVTWLKYWVYSTLYNNYNNEI